MAAPCHKIVETQTEVTCSCRKNTAAKKSVEIQTEVLCMFRRITDAKKSMETQTEAPAQDASTQVTGCDESQRLAFAVPGDGGSTCIRCDELNDLVSLVVDLKEEVERLRTIKECERETDCWCQSLLARDLGTQLKLHMEYVIPCCLANRWERGIGRQTVLQ